MPMKQKSNSTRFLNIKISSAVILAAGLLSVLEASSMQKSFEQKYTTNSLNKTLFTKRIQLSLKYK